MRRSKVTAVKLEVILLLAVIGQGLAWDLPSRNAAPVGEHREKKGVHECPFLEHVKHLFGALVHERNGAHLDTDRLGGHSGPHWIGPSQSRARGNGRLEKPPAIQTH